MAWSLSSWLMFTRIFQLLGALAAAGMNGFLTAWIYTKRLGLTQSMVILELLICIVLVYTTVAMIVQHTGQRSKKKGWLIAFLVCDVLFCAADLGIISLLSHAGLPDHCRGMTREDSNLKTRSDDDWFHEFSIMGFSDESEGRAGALDRFCGYERSFFIIALALIFTYIATIVIGALSIYSTSHTKNTRDNEILDSLERGKDDIDVKLLDSSSSPLTSAPRQSMPAAPSSEGIITRTASLRSTLTSLTSSTAAGGRRSHTISRRPVGQTAAAVTATPPPVPTRRLSFPKPSSPTHQGGGFVPIPLDEDSAEAALVTDGMNHHNRHQPQQHHPVLDESDAALVSDGMQHQHHHQSHHRRGPSSSHGQGMPMLPEEDQDADAALVSDGMRPSEPMLPPYEPGRGGMMAGHGGESNEMRLSEYVKGESRAQDMKDAGGF